jgi:hypothetical protein
MSITQITVHGTFTNSEGGAATGQIAFQLTKPIMDQAGLYIAPDPVTVLLASGAFSVPLYANNDPTTFPVGSRYDITFDVDGQLWAIQAVVPYNAAGGTINISDLAPV